MKKLNRAITLTLLLLAIVPGLTSAQSVVSQIGGAVSEGAKGVVRGAEKLNEEATKAAQKANEEATRAAAEANRRATEAAAKANEEATRAAAEANRKATEAAAWLRDFRKKHPLNGLNPKDLIDEGRRF